MEKERRGENGTQAVFIGLGSNAGDRFAHLRAGVKGLKAHEAVAFVDASPVYETEAHTRAFQADAPDYLNAVVQIRTGLPPEALLDYVLDLEERAGRDRKHETRWGPRPLDLDLLVYDDVQRTTPRLTLPHPRLGERRFVLRPLADLAPDLHVPPPFDAPAAELLARCPDEHVLRRTSHELKE